MKCSNHTDKDASAVCTACGRALCSECTTFVRDSAACVSRCEAVVESERSMRDRNIDIHNEYLKGTYADEDLLRYQTNATNSKSLLLFLSGIACYLTYRFFTSPSDGGLLFIWLLFIIGFLIFGVAKAIRKWGKLISQRKDVIALWKSR
jgi:hypothetical protein